MVQTMFRQNLGEVAHALTNFEVMHLQNSADSDFLFPPWWTIMQEKPWKCTLEIYITKNKKNYILTKVFIANTVYFTI